MSGKKYFRWMPSDCAGSEILLGSIFRPQVWQLKDLQHKYSSHPIIFCPFPAINKFIAGKKYFRWIPGDCTGSEIILGLIFRPWVEQLKYLQDEYSYDHL